MNRTGKIVLDSVLALLFCSTPVVWSSPSNVILFIGDGMGREHIRAAGMMAHGREGSLAFESFPYHGNVTTHSANASVTDSAAAATAMATGVKVNNGVIAQAHPGSGAALETALEKAQRQNKAVGLVTTSIITHATPAAFAAHEPSRENYSALASDTLQQTRPDVLFGGASYMGAAATAGYQVIGTAAELARLAPEHAFPVSGQFSAGHMTYEWDRPADSEEPHLADMTEKALQLLDTDPDGFFLMVEGARIDHASHENHTERTLMEMIAFSEAVQKALDWTLMESRFEETLILVTADHETGGLSTRANNGIGQVPAVSWSTSGHTSTPVPIYAWGAGSHRVGPGMDNTDIHRLLLLEAPTAVPAPGAFALVALGWLLLLRRRYSL